MINKVKTRIITGFMLRVKEYNEKHRKTAKITTFFSLIIIALISAVFGIVDFLCSLISGLFKSKKRIIGVALAALLILVVIGVKVFSPSMAPKNKDSEEIVETNLPEESVAQTEQTDEGQVAKPELVQQAQSEDAQQPQPDEAQQTQSEGAQQSQQVDAQKSQPGDAQQSQTDDAQHLQSDTPQETQKDVAGAAAAESTPAETTTSSNNTDEEQDTLLPISIENIDLETYIEEHPDTVGWVYFEDGHISYPIVQGSDNEKYTVLGYDGKEARTGAIFLDYRSSADFSDANSIVYGHNMKDGTMFGSLREYREDPHYYDDHQYFRIILPGKIYRYQIFEYMDVPESYELYGYVGEDALAFVKDAEPVRIKSYMDSEIVVDETKKVVTLSTCTKKDDLQFVVLGVLVEEIEESLHEGSIRWN